MITVKSPYVTDGPKYQPKKVDAPYNKTILYSMQPGAQLPDPIEIKNAQLPNSINNKKDGSKKKGRWFNITVKVK
jgi:hypothetical protein